MNFLPLDALVDSAHVRGEPFLMITAVAVVAAAARACAWHALAVLGVICAAVIARSLWRLEHHDLSGALRKPTVFGLSFPSACPERVLANDIGFHQKNRASASQKAFGRTGAVWFYIDHLPRKRSEQSA